MTKNYRLKSSIMNESLVSYLGQGGQFIDFEEKTKYVISYYLLIGIKTNRNEGFLRPQIFLLCVLFFSVCVCSTVFSLHKHNYITHKHNYITLSSLHYKTSDPFIGIRQDYNRCA